MSIIELKPTAIDLFSGAGGITQALKSVGFNVLCGVEYDPEIAESYKANHKNKLIVKDIREVKYEDIVEHCGNIKQNLDLLAGCPPCQTFSRHSKGKKVADLRNYLVFEYYRIVRLLAPKYIFLENVPGLMSNSQVFSRFIQLLDNGLGREGRPHYYVYFEKVNAADYGVPQHRERTVLVGIRKDISNGLKDAKQLFARKTHINPSLWARGCKLKRWVPIMDVIGNIEHIPAGGKSLNDALHKAANLSELNLLRLKHTRHNGGSRTDWPQYVKNEKGKTVELWLECHKKDNVSYGDVYGRMDYGKVSPTLTGGCCMLSKGRFGHPVQDRALSLREAALIQSFPINYKFVGNFSGITLQIGNAVPVKMGKNFFKTILKHIEDDNNETNKDNK